MMESGDANDSKTQYESMCLHIAQELTHDDLKTITFMLRDKIKTAAAEKIKDGKDLIRILEQRDILSMKKVRPLETLLLEAHLKSAANIVKEYRENFLTEAPQDSVSSAENYATYSMTIVQNFVETDSYRKMEEIINRERAVLVKGPPGSGKSQNAFYYAQKFNKNNPDSIVWRVHCKSGREMHLSYANLMSRLGIREVIRYSEENIKECIKKMFDRVYHQLTSEEYLKNKHLIIMDDMNSPSEAKDVHDMMEHFIIAKNIFVIGTSQSRFSPMLTHSCGMEVNRMSEDEVIKLFQSDNNITQQEEINEIKTLAKKVDYLPLCLALASSYIKITRTSVENYNKNWSELQAQAHDLSNEGKNFDASYNLTLQKLQNYLSENARKLLNYVPHFNYNIIPIQLLESLLDSGSFPKEAEINRLLTALHNYSLATISGKGENRIVSIHSVTVWFLDKKKSEDERYGEQIFLLRHFCYYIDNDARLVETMKRNVKFLDHACCLLKSLELRKDETVEIKLYKCYLNCCVAVTFHLYGNTQVSADYFFKKARHIMSDIVPLDHIDKIRNGDLDPATAVDVDCFLFGNGEIKEESKKIFRMLKRKARDIPHDTIRNFILKKVRSNRDMRLLREYGDFSHEELPHNQIPEDHLSKLIERNVVMPVEDVKELFLAELLITIMYNYSKNMVFIQDAREFDTVTEPSHDRRYESKDALREYRFALCLANQLENFVQEIQPRFHSVRYVLTKRGGITHFLKRIQNVEVFEKVIEEVNNMKTDCTTNLYIDFGVLKMCQNYNLYQRCMIENILRKCFLKLSKLKPSRKDHYTEQTLHHTEEIENILSEMDPWLALTNIHLDIAETYMALVSPHAEKAKQHFQKALAKPGLTTRYTLKAYSSYIQFCYQQGKEDDLEIAKQFAHSVVMQSTEEEQKHYVKKSYEQLWKKTCKSASTENDDLQLTLDKREDDKSRERTNLSETETDILKRQKSVESDKGSDQFNLIKEEESVQGNGDLMKESKKQVLTRFEEELLNKIESIGQLQKTMIEIEKQRLDIERQRLELEKEKVELEKQRLYSKTTIENRID